MDREIKFRGKSIQNDEWYYGYYFSQDYGEGGRKHFIVDDAGAEEIVPETVGQYTGANDINGVEIYEKDILNSYAYDNAIVRWDNEHSAFEVYCQSNAEDDQHFYVNKDVNEDYDIEVIGNMIDNKELLDG